MHMRPHFISNFPLPFKSTTKYKAQRYYSKRPYHFGRKLRTLDPSRLSSSDYVDLSRETKPYLRLMTRSPDALASWHSVYQTYEHAKQAIVPFPAKARGFLYYHSPPHGIPQAAGEIRFRLTPSDDPSSFAEGTDLKLSDGATWKEPLLSIAKGVTKPSSRYGAISNFLLDDGLVTAELLNKCNEITERAGFGLHRDSRIIHSLGQLFPINFSITRFQVCVLTEDKLQMLAFASPFLQHYIKQFAPYTGTALCCFEWSTSPAHKGTRSLVMRIKKITSPVTSQIPESLADQMRWLPKPHKGMLAVRHLAGQPWSRPLGQRQRTWTIDVDQPQNAALGQLPEASGNSSKAISR